MVGMTIAERNVRQHLIEQLRAVRGKMRKVRWIGRRFAPDEIVWRPGWKFPKLVELKAPGCKPTQGQLREHDRLRKFHIEVWVCDSFEMIDTFLASE